MTEQNKIKELISKINSLKWRKRGGWFSTPITSELFQLGEASKYAKKLGQPFIRTAGLSFREGFFDLQEEWDYNESVIVKKYKENKKYLLEHADHCLKEGEKLLNNTKKLKSLNVASLSDEELSDYYIDLAEQIKDFMPFMTGVHYFDAFLDEKFDQLLEDYAKDNKFSQEEIFDYKTALTFPKRKIFVLCAKSMLLDIALKVKKKKISEEELKSKIEEYIDKYGWMKMSSFEHNPFTEDDVKEEIENLAKTDVENEINMIDENNKELREKQEKYMEKISLLEEFKFICEAVQIFGFVRSFRIDCIYYAYFNGLNVVKEIAKRLNIALYDMFFLTSWEARDALKQEINHKELIKERQENQIGILLDEELTILSGEEAKEVIQSLKFPKSEIKDYVEGKVAYPGKVKGVCRLLHGVEDMKRVEKGDIIVISMTDPNYVPVMEKAAAFVTDMGGILCHAAIVSREMKKPCVIGTKVATKTFKDGDLVEVDAEKGIVKKIN
jgi:phosphohistidine swiveling domain-containing protein